MSYVKKLLKGTIAIAVIGMNVSALASDDNKGATNTFLTCHQKVRNADKSVSASILESVSSGKLTLRVTTYNRGKPSTHDYRGISLKESNKNGAPLVYTNGKEGAAEASLTYSANVRPRSGKRPGVLVRPEYKPKEMLCHTR